MSTSKVLTPCFACKEKGYVESQEGRFLRATACDCEAGRRWSANLTAALQDMEDEGLLTPVKLEVPEDE